MPCWSEAEIPLSGHIRASGSSKDQIIILILSRININRKTFSSNGANMYKTILVPLDGSKRAERILKHVEALAHSFNARVIFLQVVTAPNIVGYDESAILLYHHNLEALTKQAESYLSSLKGEFREKGIEAKICVVGGPVVEQVISCALRENVDLVAMCSHGRTGMARVFYGSVTAGVLNLIDRPLLIIRSRRDN
jgi:nucleotide-binding universal stress UspA family protein